MGLVTLGFGFATPKRHFLARNRVDWRILCQNRCARLGCYLSQEPIWIKFCTVVDIPDIVTYTNFGDHRLRGFWVAVGQISASHIDFYRRPYNTLALPCERVIGIPSPTQSFTRVKDWVGDRIKPRSRLNSILFCKSSLPQPFFSFRIHYNGFPTLFTVTSEHIRFFTF